MLLNKLKVQTQAKYRRHYNEFMACHGYKKCEPIDAFTQNQLDIYSARFNASESRSNQLQRVASLKLFLVESQGFSHLSFKNFSKKSQR